MSHALSTLIVLAALGTALVAGIFFAFSSFVMAALGRLAPAGGISAMQSINVTVLNPAFFTAFFGTAGVCLVLALLALIQWSEPRSLYLFAGALLYLVGTIFVTMACNVPLNNRLASANPQSAEAAALWSHYLKSWTAWNHVRTAASLAASALFLLALS